jgi:hypothetical protein
MRKVVEDFGGISNLRLTRCPDYKLVSYLDKSGQWIDLIIEDDKFYENFVIYLEEMGAAEVPWK